MENKTHKKSLLVEFVESIDKSRAVDVGPAARRLHNRVK